MIRVAAIGDIHLGLDSRDYLRPHLEGLADDADVFVIAGDLTKCGTADEARVVAAELRDVRIPCIAVLGNHDFHADEQDKVTAIMAEAGVTVLEGTSASIDVGGQRLGIAGAKGFGGGFIGAMASEFGEPEMKAFVHHTKVVAQQLSTALRSLDTDVKVAVTHYSPVEDTLEGERREIYPFLGSYLLAEAVDGCGVVMALHGHAHAGREHGCTPGGTPVRNVAQPVLGVAYKVYVVAS
ncbi:MAG TPA: metallophosphoesterase [Acidimicrobiia bacterium]|nr:metallophosphoesterase [Acidimicrobiia bacterium]